MKMTNIGKIAGVIAAVAVLATLQARASLQFNFDLAVGNTAISGYAGPYAHVAVELTSSTTATITFTSLQNSGNIYLFGDGGSVAVNVNAASWSLGSVTGSNAGTGFTPGPYAVLDNKDHPLAGNEDGFGSFNQHVNSDDGFTHAADTISFVVTDTGGTWADATDVLTKNAEGNMAAVHVFVTASPANASAGALVTGYASDFVVVPEPATMIAGALLLLPFGASTLRILRKNRAA